MAKKVMMGRCSRTSVESTRSAFPSMSLTRGNEAGFRASNSKKLICGGEGVVKMEQRSLATPSMEELRSRAFMVVMGREGLSSLMVFRPVPHPSSVMVIGVRLVERRVNACVRRLGRRRSSMDWRMLPSVS